MGLPLSSVSIDAGSLRALELMFFGCMGYGGYQTFCMNTSNYGTAVYQGLARVGGALDVGPVRVQKYPKYI